MNKTDEQLVKAAKEAFDQSVDGLDAETLSRLNRARQTALAEVRGSRREWLRWMPATGAAAVVLMVLMTQQGPGDSDAINAPLTDLDLLLSEDSIEMIEDLEFYSWLDSQELEGDGDLG